MLYLIGKARLWLLANYMGVPVAVMTKYMQGCLDRCLEKSILSVYPSGRKPTVEEYVCHFWPAIRDIAAEKMLEMTRAELSRP